HATARRGEPHAHAFARSEDALAHVRGGLAALVAQTLEGNARDMDAQVDAIEQWTRELSAVTLDLLRKAGAVAFGVAPETAGTGIHRGHEDESRGVCRGAARPRDRDGVLLE